MVSFDKFYGVSLLHLQPLHHHSVVPLPDNGVSDKPACWGEFTGEVGSRDGGKL